MVRGCDSVASGASAASEDSGRIASPGRPPECPREGLRTKFSRAEKSPHWAAGKQETQTPAVLPALMRRPAGESRTAGVRWCLGPLRGSTQRCAGARFLVKRTPPHSSPWTNRSLDHLLRYRRGEKERARAPLPEEGAPISFPGPGHRLPPAMRPVYAPARQFTFRRKTSYAASALLSRSVDVRVAPEFSGTSAGIGRENSRPRPAPAVSSSLACPRRSAVRSSSQNFLH